MELYTKKEADFLFTYYTKIIVGRTFDDSTKTKIVRLNIEDYTNGNFRVNAVSSIYPKYDVIMIKSIDDIAKQLGVILPREALKGLNQ